MHSQTLFDALTGEEAPPQHVVIEGGVYLILTDFRHWMRVESRILDASISDELKTVFLLSTFAPAIMAGQIDPRRGYPFSLENAMQSLQAFFMCERQIDPKKPGEKQGDVAAQRPERSYDFAHDIALIYAAFRSAYDMDLAGVRDMHWWLFRALFDGLPPQTAIKTLMRARAEPLAKKSTPAQRKAKEAIALPESLRYFGSGQRKTAGFGDWVAGIRARKSAERCEG